MRKQQNINSEGRYIKAMIAYAGMTQKEFCVKYNVPQNRLSDIIHLPDSSKRQLPLRARIYKIIAEMVSEKKESV